MTEDNFFKKGNQEKKEKKLHLYSSTPSALSQKSNHKIISQKIRQKKGKNTPLFFNTFSTVVTLSQKSNHKIIPQKIDKKRKKKNR